MTLLTRRQLIALGATLAAGHSHGQDYPSRPIRFVVPFPAGGPTDIATRVLAADWQTRLGWNTVVENKSGATGYIGHEDVRRSAADGYTLMPLVVPAVLNYRFLNKPFVLPDEFTPLGQIYTQFNVLLVNPAVAEVAGVRSAKDLFEAARAAPGRLSYTSAGNASLGHLTTTLLCSMAGVTMLHVPYRGDAPAVNDVLAGTVPVMFASSTTALPHVRSGKLRAVAVSSAARAAELPEVPTLSESGFAGVSAVPWCGLVAPPGLPAALVSTLAARLQESVAQPAVMQKLHNAGMTPHHLAPQAFADFVNQDYVRWGRVITENGIRATT